MDSSVFIQGEFFALILSSLVAPVCIYSYLMWRKALSRAMVLWFGVILILLSGLDVYFLERLKQIARASAAARLDARIFASEISTALYILPIIFAGIGVNLVSHVLIEHVKDAEKRYLEGPH